MNLGPVALVAITKGGARLLARIKTFLPQADAFVPEKFQDEAPFASLFKKPFKALMADLWPRYKGIVAVVSLGALVRSVAPFLKDKHSDPALVAIDDTGRFVVSVLSGHLGGANRLTSAIAEHLGAEAVITTASDSLGTIGVDILGREFGWVLESFGNVTHASASIVNEEPVGIYQDAGETDFWPQEGSSGGAEPLPKNIQAFPSLQELFKAPLSAYLIITDRIVSISEDLAEKVVLYRPKSLVLGVGCDRGLTLEELETLVHETLRDYGLSFESIRTIATIESRRTEPAIVRFAQARDLPLLAFAKEELNRVKDVPNPSSMAMKYAGVIGVAEPAAILGSGFGELVAPKVKSKRATLAIARVHFENEQEPKGRAGGFHAG